MGSSYAIKRQICINLEDLAEMKAAKVALPLTTILVMGAFSVALASPQSMLDPYANIQAPRTKNDTVRNLAKPSKKPKVKTPKTVTISTPPESARPESAHAVASSPAEGSTGVMSGAMQIMHGLGTATRGVASDIAKPVRIVGGGVVEGAKNSGHVMANSVKAVGSGMKTASVKVKDETVAAGQKVAVVPKKMGEGLKGAGDKAKDGAGAAGKAVATLPKTMGSGIKGAGGKLVNGTETVGGKLAAMPKAIGKGLFGAASKTAVATKDATKKVASVPLSIGRRLNPFHHDQAQGIATASAPQVSK
jgi:hypothetical protein